MSSETTDSIESTVQQGRQLSARLCLDLLEAAGEDRMKLMLLLDGALEAVAKLVGIAQDKAYAAWYAMHRDHGCVPVHCKIPINRA